MIFSAPHPESLADFAPRTGRNLAELADPERVRVSDQ